MAEKLKYYTRREEFLNAVSHISGVIFGIFAGFSLYRRAIAVDRTPFTIGIIFYWFSFMAMFAASSFYHLCRTESHKVFARKLDHCAIYLLITGTYAPLITGAVKTVGGYSVLAVLGVLSLLGIVKKFFFADKFHYLEVIIYLIMGWACVFIASDLLSSMTASGLHLLLYGGISYTGGVVFYAVKREFFHALWHLFVLGGAILQFFAILTIGNI